VLTTVTNVWHEHQAEANVMNTFTGFARSATGGAFQMRVSHGCSFLEVRAKTVTSEIGRATDSNWIETSVTETKVP
jgi:hypothetical protein